MSLLLIGRLIVGAAALTAFIVVVQATGQKRQSDQLRSRLARRRYDRDGWDERGAR